MQNKIERLIGLVYKKWKLDELKVTSWHPDEEALACFLEGRLEDEESAQIKEHLLACDACAEAFALSLKLNEEAEDPPEELLARVKNSVLSEQKSLILEIALRLKEKALEIINTTGDVLLGQELVPAPILRSRQIKDFKDEVTILKDFNELRVEAKVENKGKDTFNLIIVVKQKETQKVLKDLRVTLMKEDLELESYLADTGSVTFEHVLLGKYRVEISTIENNLASILLDIKT